MTLVNEFGPLIETGEIDGFTYEVRGTTHPMIYVYRELNGVFVHNVTQQGSSSAQSVARMLIAELPKAAK
ncbi:hypothetical protein [Rhizobium leguminosarum]|uniref:hypothetical protein n=1 Tax=Rhizobium leguminosarum TaxID=384 RepID=UPI0013BE0726|nr:hypothetical protein [Rhizobium leguminosarum]MBY5325211.1 hypothetical protein [Rhizobium leguminosarum]MBY5384917.1 hypothetical protein [Rhizobium leguminosarum]MCA2436204.1 hypothetical protein [Rhizobium leguminosarum]NEH73833.1 hypothetical protein [Rhizobium leguminosarum]